MKNAINKILKGFKECLTEDGELSLTRLIAFTGWVAFLIGSFYLLFKGIDWSLYSDFSIMTAGGGAVTQLSNKFINSKYNTIPHGTDKNYFTTNNTNKISNSDNMDHK